MQKLDDAIAHMTLLAMVADTVLTRLREGFDAALAPWLWSGVIKIKKLVASQDHLLVGMSLHVLGSLLSSQFNLIFHHHF